MISGEVTLVLNGVESMLTAGDAATISAQMPYRPVNSSGQPAQLLVVSSCGGL